MQGIEYAGLVPYAKQGQATVCYAFTGVRRLVETSETSDPCCSPTIVLDAAGHSLVAGRQRRRFARMDAPKRRSQVSSAIGEGKATMYSVPHSCARLTRLCVQPYYSSRRTDPAITRSAIENRKAERGKGGTHSRVQPPRRWRLLARIARSSSSGFAISPFALLTPVPAAPCLSLRNQLISE